MSKGTVKANGGVQIQWLVTGCVRSDTINVIELVARRLTVTVDRGSILDQKDVKIGQMPWVGNIHPTLWFEKLNVAVSTAASVVRNLMGHPCQIDGDSFQKNAEEVVRAVSAKMKGAITDAQGRKVIKTEPDGAILAVQPEDVKVEGQDAESPILTIPADVVAEAEAAANSTRDEPEAAPGPRLIGPDDPPNEPTGRIIL